MASTTIEGKVSLVNGSGFKIYELPDWLNVSKYAKSADVPMPVAGTRVRLTLDASNYVRKIESLGAPHEQEPEAPTCAPVDTHSAPIDTKDARITRLACLNTATAILYGNTGRGNVDEVLEVAAKLESWVLR